MTSGEYEVLVGGQPAGWYPDPLAPASDPTRRRWFTGAGWVSRVCSPIEAGGPSADRGVAGDSPGPAGSPAQRPEGIAWISGLERLAPPPVVAPVAPVARVAPVAPVAPVALLFDADPMVVAFGRPEPTAASGAHEESPRNLGGDVVGADVANLGSRARRHRRRVGALAFTVALVLLVGGAIAGADIVSGGGAQRPTLDGAITYRDADAGFALRYPSDWRVIQREHGTGIRFAIGALGAPTTETNTVSVTVGTTAAELPELHTLADQLTQRLRDELPDIRLEEAGRAPLAGAPGLRFTFVEPGVPRTRIEQFVGRTTAGRPLTITVTVREPRTAPTATELRGLLASLTAI